MIAAQDTGYRFRSRYLHRKQPPGIPVRTDGFGCTKSRIDNPIGQRRAMKTLGIDNQAVILHNAYLIAGIVDNGAGLPKNNRNCLYPWAQVFIFGRNNYLHEP